MSNPHFPAPAAAATGAVLLLLTVAVRFPFFFPAVIDWDESTFILIGQSVADGHLPYTQTWDVKPPLGFVFYAGLIQLLGHSVTAIRLGGVICVATAAFLVYVIASQTWRSAAAAWAAALLTVGGMSLLASAQATMLEHVMLVPFTGALAVLLCGRRATRTWFAAGALIGMATLIRFNAAFAVIALGAFVYADARRHTASAVRALAAFGGGAAAVVASTIVIYIVAGEFDTFWTTIVDAPASYVEAQLPPLTTLIRQTRNAFGITPQAHRVPWLTGLLWVMAFAGVGMAWLRWRAAGEQERRGVLLISLGATATAASVVLSGQALEHYLIQLVPVAAVGSGGLFIHASRRVEPVLWGALGVCAALSSTPVVTEYRNLITRISRGEPLPYGQAYDLAAYLTRENASRRPVFLLNDHLAYWLMHMAPPTRFATHPSFFSHSGQLAAAFDTTAADELRAVFRRRPEFVVIPENVWFMDCSLERVLRESLAQGYAPDARIGNNYLYRLRSRDAALTVIEPAADRWTAGCAMAAVGSDPGRSGIAPEG